MEAKETLVKLLYEWEGHRFKDEIANAIIKAFPQIEKKPVQLYKTDDEICIILDKRFATENERQAWLDSHYVELVD